jgi:hypothetical protein
MIRLETSKRTGIDNVQVVDISAFERNWNARIPKAHPRAEPRTQPSPIYNCHGLTFASRRTRVVDPRSISRILQDDGWVEIEMKEVLAGDVVVYYSLDGDPNHSGIVISMDALGIPEICSKWGSAGEFNHKLADHPAIYGPNTRFYRCRL